MIKTMLGLRVSSPEFIRDLRSSPERFMKIVYLPMMPTVEDFPRVTPVILTPHPPAITPTPTIPIIPTIIAVDLFVKDALKHIPIAAEVQTPEI